MDDVGAAILQSQPVLRILRERHPDVSVVVLDHRAPPPVPTDATGVGLAHLRDVSDDVDDAWADLVDRVPEWEPSKRFAQWEAVTRRRHRYVLTWVGRPSQEAGLGLLDHLVGAANRAGWAAELRRDAAVPALRADNEAVVLQADVGAAGTRVRLESRVMVVDTVAERALRQGWGRGQEG